jgi:hypothetical protein
VAEIIRLIVTGVPMFSSGWWGDGGVPKNIGIVNNLSFVYTKKPTKKVVF